MLTFNVSLCSLTFSEDCIFIAGFEQLDLDVLGVIFFFLPSYLGFVELFRSVVSLIFIKFVYIFVCLLILFSGSPIICILNLLLLYIDP